MYIRLLPLLCVSSLSVSACAAPTEIPAQAPPVQAPVAEAPIILTAQAPTVQVVTAAPLSQSQRFEKWKQKFINEAAAKGYNRARVSTIINPAKINEKALDRDSKQPEFSRPIWAYVDGAASKDRLAKGKAKLSAHKADFDKITSRYPVDRNILTAIWGLESSYGRIQGTHNIVDALSTFAFEGRRQKFGTEQLYAVLDMDGDGNKNLWKSEQDALGSAAHYLARHGWEKTEPVITEINVPTAFNYGLSDGKMRSIAEWSALGVTPMNGRQSTQSALNYSRGA